MLKPNLEILHDKADVTYLASEGSTKHSQKLGRLGYKVYNGVTMLRTKSGTFG